MYNHIIPRHPVDRGCDLVLISRLQRIHHTQHFSRIATRRSRVGENEANGLLGIDNKHASDGESNALLIDIGGVLVVQHVIHICNLPLLVANDWESQFAARDFIDISDPSAMRFDRICRETDQFDAAFGELRFQFGKSAELRGAYWGVVLGV